MRFKPALRRLDQSPTFVFIAASYTAAGGDGVSVGQTPVGATIGAFAYQLVRGEHPTSRGDREDTHPVDGSLPPTARVRRLLVLAFCDGAVGDYPHCEARRSERAGGGRSGAWRTQSVRARIESSCGSSRDCARDARL
jgi:hypothetical protein